MAPSFKHRSEGVVRRIASGFMKHLRYKDIEWVHEKTTQYWRGYLPHFDPERNPAETLLAETFPGAAWRGDRNGRSALRRNLFVYEREEAPHLVKLRGDFHLDDLLASPVDEYASILAVGAWLGAQWDHGTDALPETSDVGDIIHAGRQGKKYWCEIASKVGVQLYSALGWPARLVTASRDGYHWEHAVSEVWCNQLAKWVVVDSDFNIVYEAGGVPLSSFELCHDGPRLAREGALVIRRIGPAKPSLHDPNEDLLPFYAYVHIDLRTDWFSRSLGWGSPVGGDLSTWWTARPDFRAPITAKVRVDDKRLFDWPVNQAWMHLLGVERAGARYRVRAGVEGYSPYFGSLQARAGAGAWTKADPEAEFDLGPGEHRLEARVLDARGRPGVAREIVLRLPV